jgi:hypothetical protein
MLISFCRQCLQDTQNKVVIAYGRRRVDIDIPHDIHPEPPIRNGLFSIPQKDPRTPAKGWDQIYVEGDDAQTKANIIAQYEDEFGGDSIPIVIPDP